MALDPNVSQPTEAQAPSNQPTLESLTDEEENDLRTAVLIAERMFEEEGYSIIEQALNTSSDPAQVIGQFLIQMIKSLDENMPNNAKLSRRIWLAQGGWVEQVMDMIIEEFDLDYAIADKAEVYIGTTIAQMAKAGQTSGSPAPQPQDAAQMPIPQRGAIV